VFARKRRTKAEPNRRWKNPRNITNPNLLDETRAPPQKLDAFLDVQLFDGEQALGVKGVDVTRIPRRRRRPGPEGFEGSPRHE